MGKKLIVVLCSFVLLAGCHEQEKEAAEVYIPDTNSVGFDIEPALEPHTSVWIGTYHSQGKTARFRFQLGPAKTSDYPIPNVRVTSGRGKFTSVNGSEADVLLNDLKIALEAKKVPAKVPRVAELPFTYVTFREHQSQALSDGGFNNKPRGHWTVSKIFIGEGEHECEFFLNFNPIMKKGQFSIKDPDYGDEILEQLAKVL
jgi:hypothetical protein